MTDGLKEAIRTIASESANDCAHEQPVLRSPFSAQALRSVFNNDGRAAVATRTLNGLRCVAQPIEKSTRMR